MNHETSNRYILKQSITGVEISPIRQCSNDSMKSTGLPTPASPHSTLQSPKRYIVANEGLKGLESSSEQFLLLRDLRASAYVPRRAPFRGLDAHLGMVWYVIHLRHVLPARTFVESEHQPCYVIDSSSFAILQATYIGLGFIGGPRRGRKAPRNPNRILRRS